MDANTDGDDSGAIVSETGVDVTADDGDTAEDKSVVNGEDETLGSDVNETFFCDDKERIMVVTGKEKITDIDGIVASVDRDAEYVITSVDKDEVFVGDDADVSYNV